MHPHYKAPVELLLKLLNFNGVNPLKRTNLAKILVTVELTTIPTTILLVFLQFVYKNMSMKLFADSVESLFSCTQLFVKILALVSNQDEIRELLEDMSKFWDLDEFDSKFRQECVLQLQNVKSVSQTFVILCASVMVFFMCCPFIVGRLAIVCYEPEFIPGPLFALYDSFVFGYNGMGVVAFDCFVCTTIFLLQLQFKVLNKRISLLKLDETWVDEKIRVKEVSVIIEYHQFLYRFLGRFNSIIGVTCFIQFILYTISMCFEMYFFTRGSNFVESFKSLLYITTLSFEMVICFCIPSTFIAEEASKTQQVLYESKWYLSNSAMIKKNILILMGRSQQVAALWAGNLFVVNLETCTEAFKKTLSFYACLKTVGE